VEASPVAQAVSTSKRVGRHVAVRTVGPEIGRAIGAGLDGLLIGLTVGYIALTAVGAPWHHLGLPWPAAIAAVGGLATGLAQAGAAVVTVIARSVGGIGGRAASVLRGSGRRRLAAVVDLAARLVDGLPAPWIGAFAVLLWIGLEGRTAGPLGLLTPPGMLSTFVYALGLAAAMLATARALTRSGMGPVRRSLAGLLVLTAAAVVTGLTAFAVWPGSTAGLVAYDPAFDRVTAVESGTATDLGDPGAPGPFMVERLSYGSGADDRRPAFGVDADLITPTVDASAALRLLGHGADEARQAFWGFGREALPLDGLVWAPRGAGPFPLALIVHGNHAMGDFSEDGYAYLGEHLASRGVITVSVDEDFLNGSWAGDWQGSEQLVRAWLLLLHVDQWRDWNADPTGPFAGRVDLDRVAVIGHSRGGEAAAVAAMLADRTDPPRAGLDPWPTGLRISAVVAIAPSDGQYAPGVRLENVDFLTLQGGFDSDARAWSGIRQYARSQLGDDGFKAAIWSYRANHGQFNTAWGRDDQGPFSGTHLAFAPLLRADEQEDLAKTAIGAFLEVSFNGHDDYRGLFQRPMTGREWLPEDIILVRSASAGAVGLTGASPDQPAEGLTITSDGLTASAARVLPLRALQPDQVTRAVQARWTPAADRAVWAVSGIANLQVTPDRSTEVRFALADGTVGEGTTTPRLDIEVEVVDGDGTTVALPLDAFGALPPPLPVHLAKHDLLQATTTIDISLRTPVERVLQTYAIPLAAFAAVDPAFSVETLDAIRLRIDRSTAGALWIADLSLGDGGA
jgi:hypothetical protein